MSRIYSLETLQPLEEPRVASCAAVSLPVACSFPTPPRQENQDRVVSLKVGYEAWAVTIEHPDRDALDGYLRFPHAKLSQWELAYPHGSFPSVPAGTILSFLGQSYRLLASGSNSLRVQVLTSDAFWDHPAPLINETCAFMATPVREERLEQRRAARQHRGRSDRPRRIVEDPQFASTTGLRLCYETTVRQLPRTLCDALPSWARGGSKEEPTSMLRVCYLQFYLRDENGILVLWERPQGQLTTLPDHCKVTLEMCDLTETPVLTLKKEEAAVLVRQIACSERPARITFVAPASFLTDEMRTMIAPVVSFPVAAPLAGSRSRVSLERGEHVAIPRMIVQRRVEDLGVSASTLGSLLNADITTVGEFLELEEAQLRAILTPSSLWDMYVSLAASGALPIYESAAQEYPENAIAQEQTLTRLPQFELAARKREQVFCELEDSSVQEVTRVRARRGILQVQQECDGEWVAPLRFWTVLHRSQHQQNERRMSSRIPATLSGFLPADEGHVEEQNLPIYQEFYYQLNGRFYDDQMRGRLYQVEATAVVERLDGRKSGSVQTLWLTRNHVGQSLRWDRSMKQLDTLELRMRVNGHARQRGADLAEQCSPEDLDLARKQGQAQAEHAYNRVPVRDPYSKKDRPLELFVSCDDLADATSDQASPPEAIQTVVERYIRFPEALPLAERLPHRMLLNLQAILKEDQARVRTLNRIWNHLFPGQPHPPTTSLIREPVYLQGRLEPKVIGYRFIIGVLSTTSVPPGFVLEPRRGKPMIPIPDPVLSKRTPNYVIIADGMKKKGTRKAVA